MAFVWEQRKFVEFVKNAAKKNKDNIDLEPYAVTNDRGFIAQKDAHDDFGYMSNVDRTAYNIVPPNSFAYNPARINVGSLGYYEGTENVIVSSLYEVFQTEEYIDDKFLLHWFKSDSFPRWIEKLQEGSVRLYFYFDKLVQCQMMVPSLEEQKRISAYLDSIDQLITLHQRKRMLRRCFFSIDWEQRKLGDITESYSGGTPTAGKKEYYDGNIPFIRSGEISSDKTELFISEEGLNRSSAKMVKIGDILYALYGATSGEVSISKLKGAINQAILAIQPHQNYDSQFLMQWLRKSKENIIGTYLQGGQGNLSGNIVKELIIDIPTYEEQKEIGAYLKKLDHLITLHQCKSNFCKKNEVNAWEQRKLGDLVERITKKNQDLLSELPLTISAQYGLIDQKEFFDKRVASKDISGYYLIKNGEFAYNKSTSTDAPWGAIKRLDRYETGVLSTLYIVFGIKKDTELNSNFLTAYYSTNLWHKEIHEIAAEGARNHGLLNISPADFFKTKLSTPQDLKEQNKIGNYFIQLDQLITLHQWECNINENTEGNDEKQRKPIKKLIISEGNLSLVDDMFLLHRMTFLVCNKYILLRLNVVKYKITIIIISNILYSIVSLLIIACYLIVINKQLIILIYVEISVVIIKGDDDYARIRS